MPSAILDKASEAMDRAWPTGGTIDRRELYQAVALVIMYLKKKEADDA